LHRTRDIAELTECKKNKAEYMWDSLAGMNTQMGTNWVHIFYGQLDHVGKVST
jgi:hypothetical protein